jgi:hypothetical protein
MPMYRPDSEHCRRCLNINHPTPCWSIPQRDEPSDCAYRMEREGRTLSPVPFSVDRCTEMYPDLNEIPEGLCARCGLNRGDNATCCHEPKPKEPEETMNKTCSTCKHNPGVDGKIKFCKRVCTWFDREGWEPRTIDEPTPAVTASRFYTPTVEDEMKEIKPVVGWEE